MKVIIHSTLKVIADSEHIQETLEHGGQGCTDNPRDLFEMITKAVIERQVG